jgi:hypothetical protein
MIGALYGTQLRTIRKTNGAPYSTLKALKDTVSCQVEHLNVPHSEGARDNPKYPALRDPKAVLSGAQGCQGLNNGAWHYSARATKID